MRKGGRAVEVVPGI